MSYILRDLPPAIVQIDTETIRATKGTSELITRPSITIPACYAIPRASSSKLDSTSEPNGDAVAVESTGESRSSWITGDQLSKARSESDFEAKWDLKYPFRESKAAEDWVGREYIFQHLLTLLDIKTAANLSPLLLVPAPSPPSLPLDLQALYTQLAFETLNVPGLSILPSPLATVYALGVTSGVVLHIGWETSEVFVVTDSIVRWECSTTAAVGAKHCEEFFEKLLLADSALDTELSMAAGRGSEVDWEAGQKEALIKEVCSVVWNECTGEDIQVPPIKGVNAIVSGTSAEADESNFDVAKKLVGDPVAPAPASHKKKVPPPRPAAASAAAAAASAPAQVAEDLIAINIPSLPGKDIALGPVRHRLCEPLLLGLEKGSDTVWEGMGRAVESSALNLVERLSLWDAVCVVGDLARIKSFSPSLTTYLAPYLLSSSDVPSDLQPAKVRLLSIPDYFGNYKGSTTDLAPFLGASMVARAAFNDSLGKHCITKADYDDKGPAAIYITGGSDDR